GVFAGCLAQAVGGRMPADQETIRYWGVHGTDGDGRWYLMREVLGGGSGGRFYADGSDAIHIVPDSKNLPAEFAETRFPVRVERLALAMDSGGPEGGAAASATTSTSGCCAMPGSSRPRTVPGWAATGLPAAW